MTASALLRNGPPDLARLLAGLAGWLDAHKYASVEHLKGSMSQVSWPDSAAFERASYVQALVSFSRPGL